jgi:hypothetical protein
VLRNPSRFRGDAEAQRMDGVWTRFRNSSFRVFRLFRGLIGSFQVEGTGTVSLFC